MVSVITQRHARERRRHLKFCYLCGQGFLDGDEKRREHLVPRAVLGDPPSSASWSLLLDVHRSCEEQRKREADTLFTLWQRLFLPPEERAEKAYEELGEIIDAASPGDDDSRMALGLATVKLAAETSGTSDLEAIHRAFNQYFDALISSGGLSDCQKSLAQRYLAAGIDLGRYLELGHYRNTPFKAIDGVVSEDSMLPIDGFNDIQEAVWTWVRGLHAVLYGEFLPVSSPHVLLTALPTFCGTSSPRPFPGKRVDDLVLGALDAADLSDKLDRVQWWDGQCVFRSVWVHSPGTHELARCIWRLDTPGPSGTGAWWGWYDASVPPAEAGLLDESDVALYNDRYGLE